MRFLVAVAALLPLLVSCCPQELTRQQQWGHLCTKEYVGCCGEEELAPREMCFARNYHKLSEGWTDRRLFEWCEVKHNEENH
tara:strand:- start:2404 stop:2649 length:246 start_codon:yes stop_codon:yes gene_type:complete